MQKAACLFTLMIGALFPLQAEQSAALSRFERAVEIYQSARTQVPLELALCMDELDAGAEAGLWEKLHPNVPPEYNREGAAIGGLGAAAVPPPPLTELERLTALPEFIVLKLAPGVRFKRQLDVLNAVKEESLLALSQSAFDYACEVWLAAKNRDELRPALPVLLAAQVLTQSEWWKCSSPNGPLDSGTKSLSAVRDAFSIFGSSAPLLLPDPRTNPVAYAAARAEWTTLQTQSHVFVNSPQIHARFLELEALREVELSIRRGQIHAAMLGSANENQFGSLLADYSALFPALPQRPFFRPDTASYFREPSSLYDYKELIAPRIYHMRNEPPTPHEREIHDYDSWLHLLKGEFKDDFWLDYCTERTTLPPLVSDALSRQVSARLRAARSLAANGEPPPPASSPGTPISALVDGLRRLAYENPRHRTSSTIAELIADWEKLATPGATVPFGRFRSWKAIAGLRKSSAVFALRDRAVKELLGRIMPVGSHFEPLETQLKDDLDAALQSSALDVAARLLSLDSAGGILDPDEHLSYDRALKLLRDTETHLEDGTTEQLRQAWLDLLRACPLLSICDIAAVQLKKLPLP